MHRFVVLLLASTLCTSPAYAQDPSLIATRDQFFTRGVDPALVIRGLKRGDTATVHAWRGLVRQNKGVVDTITMHAYARYVGTGSDLALATTRPVAGSFTTADPLAFIWSMTQVDTTVRFPVGRLSFVLEVNGRNTPQFELPIRNAAPNIERTWVTGSNYAGYYAVQSDGKAHPSLIALHGSEGGDSTFAKSLAESFANHGYATFSLIYFSWGTMPMVPTGLVNIPIGMVDSARAWLGRQASADTSRTGIWGVSKGAELALVTGAHRTWPRAIVACVPSDLVWTGFGRPPKEGERYSSWSDGGVSLRFMPYDGYDEVLASKTTARIVHDRSRVTFADSVQYARIDVERIASPLLLLGSGRDEVWNSAEMSRAIVARRSAAGLKTDVLVHEDAGHVVCGTAATPWLFYEREYPTPSPPSARATLEAQSDNWRRTLHFLSETLHGTDFNAP